VPRVLTVNVDERGTFATRDLVRPILVSYFAAAAARRSRNDDPDGARYDVHIEMPATA